MGIGLILGFFDGVHVAHQAVIRSAKVFADKTVLISLKNFHKNSDYILTREESFKKIKSLGVNSIEELDFREISTMPAEEFLEFLVKKYSPISISSGFNYTFGYKRSGDTNLLALNQEKYGYKYICTPPLEYNGKIVSSTLIKSLLQEGHIKEANALLKSNFILEGEVIKGAQLGRTIGFPTANINYPQGIIKIPFGVYKAKFNGLPSVLNWGIKPTVHNTKEPIAELHILDFAENLYGKNIRIEVLDKIRDEQRFNSLEELKAQIKKDVEACLK